MISKSTIKLVKALTLKKQRQKEGLFLVEGDKNTVEALKSHYTVSKLFATPSFLSATAAVSANATVFGAFLEGKNVFTENLPSKALLVVGNEGRGISREIEKNIQKKIVIPGFSKSDTGAESLNVAVATGILCSEFKRQHTF